MLKYFNRKKKRGTENKSVRSPDHVAIIMDGNGRWANSRGLTRVAGHRKGAEAVKNALRGCINNNVFYLTIFAFSSENWNRPEKEIQALMNLFTEALQSQIPKFNEHNIKVQLIGDLSKFSDEIQELGEEIQRATSTNSKLTLSVAVNYGGRWDITQACKKIAEKVANGELEVDQIDEPLIDQHMATYGLPDPDLFIRTSGEYRISNFLLWQAAYAEFFFTDVLWPDFDEGVFEQALVAYASRDRRYGRVDEVPLGKQKPC